ncbi:hypothetical protein SAMN04488020_101256 [Palleronia marisminoris]|uniref:Phosphoadenosine phosphosulfate reductase n=1 Tax=Palleronia marisminoris TaxID=315423 RepID=A0A1Y5RGV8_9RHOB|nr:hypothetical protein [Palleronia marisminoris]SFG13044.1 hypothetical protein SAMN04488020_101256 [Palleronia marisminoris]SLN14400.1 hypothetical protein PAM7066_00257 [Palleronia marisminoris]
MNEMVEHDLERPGTVEDLHDALADLAGSRGSVRTLDSDHFVTFVPRGATLLVTFEETGRTLARDSGVPISADFADDKNWSILHVAARRRSWFRSEAMFSYFDELADDVFFDEYDRVIFYGAGPGGFAAATYSVTAPGARVILVEPLATVDRSRAGWDSRFYQQLLSRPGPRYPYAPDMIEAAEAAFLLYDPSRALDHVHASLFAGSNVTHLRANNLTTPKDGPLETTLEEIGALHPMIEGLGSGRLGHVDIYRLLRARRDHMPFLTRTLRRSGRRNSAFLTAVLCRYVTARRNSPPFQKHLKAALRQMEAEGALPGTFGAV